MELTIDHISRREVLHYLGWRGAESECPAEVNECMELMHSVLRPKYVWRKFALSGRAELLPQEQSDRLWLAGTDLALPGESIRALLKDCEECVLLAATCGVEADALIRRTAARSMARSVILDACGSAAIESVCDAAEREILSQLEEGSCLTDRFSPGYGDLPITLQPRLAALLDTARKIGLSVTDSCTMLPMKSVTAIIGIAHVPQKKRFRGCGCCNLFEHCAFRKGGHYCGRE